MLILLTTMVILNCIFVVAMWYYGLRIAWTILDVAFSIKDDYDEI